MQCKLLVCWCAALPAPPCLLVMQLGRLVACPSQPTSRTGLHPSDAGIPPAPRGTPQIEVSFEIDANGEGTL